MFYYQEKDGKIVGFTEAKNDDGVPPSVLATHKKTERKIIPYPDGTIGFEDELTDAIRQDAEMKAKIQGVRVLRNMKLKACDYVMCADVYASMSAEQQTAWAAYRQALRDITTLDGFPWDGGGEETPWPAQPE